MTNLANNPFAVEFDRGLVLALIEEPGTGPAGRRAYRLEVQVDGAPLEGPIVFGRAQTMRLMMAMAKLARTVDRRGLPGEGAS
jgi:hypothetical protein